MPEHLSEREARELRLECLKMALETGGYGVTAVGTHGVEEDSSEYVTVPFISVARDYYIWIVDPESWMNREQTRVAYLDRIGSEISPDSNREV